MTTEAIPRPARPLLIYDGDCSFCKRWIARWKYLTGDAVDYEPYQSAAHRFGEIPREEFGKSVFLIRPDGTITRAAAAVLETLALAGRKRYLLWLYQHVGAFAWLAEALYAFIARSRNWLDPIDRIVVGTQTRPATHMLTRALFLRTLGVVYLTAFLSLFIQIDGLIGSRGILPATDLVDAAAAQLGAARWWQLPTLAYLDSSDAFLHALCIGGIVCSCLLIVGALPLLMTIALWAMYLSLTVVCRDFLSFQWDMLLLETGFLAIFWAPPLWAGTKTPPSRIVLFLIRWLLFRLMFLSALVKWYSGDDSWRKMQALRYHFESQPLPTWTSWYAHHSPPWMLAVACFCMFFVEGFVPFLYFAPRRTRMLAFWLTVLLQINIMVTGNYGFFNLLTIVLALTLLDDAAVSRATLLRLPPIPSTRPWLRRWIILPVALVLIPVHFVEAIERLRLRRIERPAVLATLRDYVAPFRSANAYGLFAAMTKDRPELVFEGSDDGVNWKEYEFKYKPGDIYRRPAFCEPHMPRLDWNLWFPFLQGRGIPQWFARFAQCVLEGKRPVLELLAVNPFPDHPPKYLRALLYDYHFSGYGSTAWWTRKPIGIYLPPVSLRQQTPTDQNFRL